jgi:hypothetical protein
MLVYTLFTVSYVMVAADLPDLFLYASIGIFGLAVWSIPTIMSAAVGDYMGPVQAVRAFWFHYVVFRCRADYRACSGGISGGYHRNVQHGFLALCGPDGKCGGADVFSAATFFA